MKKNSKEMLLSTILCLLPIVFGIVVYNKLPQEIPTKWYADGTTGQYMSKAVTVFALPMGMAVVNMLVHFCMNTDPKRKNIEGVLRTIGKWFSPVLSILLVPCSLLWGLGYEIPIERIVPILIGLLFLIIGNYLPRCRRNYTQGIKTPWTLNSDENWRKTHHLAGYLWIFGGLLMMLLAFAPEIMVKVGVVLLLVLTAGIPFVYSYTLYRKGI